MVGVQVLDPQWDTDDSNTHLDRLRQVVLKKCGCKKSRCLTNSCSCKKNGNGTCTNLCTCNDCANRIGEKTTIGESEDEDQDGEYDDDEEEEEEDDEMRGEMNNDEYTDDRDLQEMLNLLSEDDSEEEEENFVNYLLA